MSNALPILSLILLVAIAVTGVTVARWQGVSSLRIYVEILTIFVGGALALLPCACIGVPIALASGPYGRSPLWPDLATLIPVGAGAVIALCRVNPPRSRTVLPAAAVALLGFAAATGVSLGVWFLMPNASGPGCFFVIAPLSIASATVGSYALAIGPH